MHTHILQLHKDIKHTPSSQDFDTNLTAHSKKVELKINHRLFNIQNEIYTPRGNGTYMHT